MIRFENVSFRYPEAAGPVLSEVSLHLPEGDLCLVVGGTGSGKSTLLGTINALVPTFTGGTLSGRVTIAGRDTAHHRPRELADLVGYVGQDPVRGFVTDTVEDEIAYGMEQLGIRPMAMRKRVEETLDLLGLAELRRRPLAELSGGQQQRAAIAAVLAAQPRVLVLDEPTSALDPTAAQDVLAAISTLVHEVGLTVVLAEHRLERVMQAADSMIWLPGDGSAQYGEPAEILARASVQPPLAALARALGWSRVPLSVREARRAALAAGLIPAPGGDEHTEEPGPGVNQTPEPAGEVVLTARSVEVRFGAITAVRGVDLDLTAGSITTVLGRNGAGKSSLLWALQGALSCSGAIAVAGVDPRSLGAFEARRLVTLVPQTAADLLYLPSVAAECAQADIESQAPPGTAAGLLAELGMNVPLDRDPRDLSEGQRLALVLAIQLAADPKVLLLDEPTRGLDYQAKAELRRIVTRVASGGVAVLVSTHDVEFAAGLSRRTLLMADGEIVADGSTVELLTSSPAYAPQLAKVFAPAAVLTVDDVVAGLR